MRRPVGRGVRRSNGRFASSPAGDGGNGFNVYTQTYPDQKLSIVVLANTSGPPAGNAGTRIATALFEAQGK